jgi:type III restriction enzyme
LRALLPRARTAGHNEPRNLIVEVKGYRGEDAKTKKQTAEQFWVLGVNVSARFGRAAFVELTEPFTMRDEFDRVVRSLLLREAA